MFSAHRLTPRLRAGARAALLLVSMVWMVVAGRFHTPHAAGADQHCQVCALASVAKTVAPASGSPTLPLGRVVTLATEDQPQPAANPPALPARARSPPVR